MGSSGSRDVSSGTLAIIQARGDYNLDRVELMEWLISEELRVDSRGDL